MNWQQFVEDYLRFSKKGRIGLLCLVALLFLAIILPIVFNKHEPLSIEETKVLSAVIDTLNAKQTQQYKNDKKEEEYIASSYQFEPSVKSKAETEVFIFDPNTLSKDGWKRLGLKDRTIQTIEKYKTKGGRFYNPEDLQKIWGLPNGFYELVKDYIRIERPAATRKEEFVTVSYSKTDKKSWNIEINSADVVTLEELPGIGNKLATRIVSFRDKLGGFYSVAQIGETYGLTDSVFQKIKSYLYTNGNVKKININTATKDELKVHPYIKWNLANAIVEYRNQHGNYKSLDDMKNIAAIDEGTFTKIVQYLNL
jgi:competence ComEA-like helix-hairpin-helix protein